MFGAEFGVILLVTLFPTKRKLYSFTPRFMPKTMGWLNGQQSRYATLIRGTAIFVTKMGILLSVNLETKLLSSEEISQRASYSRMYEYRLHDWCGHS